MNNMNFAGLMEADGVQAATFEALARQNAQINRNTTEYKQRLYEAQVYLNNLRTRQTRIPLREAMSTSDFPNLFGDILSDRRRTPRTFLRCGSRAPFGVRHTLSRTCRTPYSQQPGDGSGYPQRGWESRSCSWPHEAGCASVASVGC
jgi:hypothetical protein